MRCVARSDGDRCRNPGTADCSGCADVFCDRHLHPSDGFGHHAGATGFECVPCWVDNEDKNREDRAVVVGRKRRRAWSIVTLGAVAVVVGAVLNSFTTNDNVATIGLMTLGGFIVLCGVVAFVNISS